MARLKEGDVRVFLGYFHGKWVWLHQLESLYRGEGLPLEGGNFLQIFGLEQGDSEDYLDVSYSEKD